MALFKTSDFDFDLPDELIAQYPAANRSASRLLDARDFSTPRDLVFSDLPSFLKKGDLLVLNDTKVIKARLFGKKPSGGRLEVLVERVLSDYVVAAHMKVSKKPAVGAVLEMDGGFFAKFLGRYPDDNGALFKLEFSGNVYELMQSFGHVPLPPYISHSDSADDELRYQTVFAKNAGAVAAPTAALHFDDDLLEVIRDMGVNIAYVTLHVGAGTFAPVKSENLSEHVMHFERYFVPQETIDAINVCKSMNSRVIAVGTTCVRSLESFALSGQAAGDTNIFITPGFDFKLVDCLITNFHLPKSTLMMLISAFAGFDNVMGLYRYAIDNGYRFFSYGDSMFLNRS